MSARAGGFIEEAEADVLTHLNLPAEHRKRIRTNNLQERMNEEVKTWSRWVQVFPSAESMLRLVGTVYAEQDEDWSSRRYVSPDPPESEEPRRKDPAIVKTAMGLDVGGRRAV